MNRKEFTVFASCLGLLLIMSCWGCTVRGGWPRFLRWGEASDGAIRRELAAREGAVADLRHLLDLRATSSVDLEAVGKSLVKKWGRDGASYAVYSAWPAHQSVTNACNVIWLQDQPARVRDVAWLICYRQQWEPHD